MNIVLFDSNQKKYFPLSLTRPVSDFRFGILTIKEKWEYYFKDVSVKAESYLNDKFHLNISSDNLWIDSQVIPTDDLIIELNNLREGEGLISNDVVIGFRYCNFNLEKINFIESNANISILEKMVDLFYKMNSQLKNDFELLTKGKESEKLDNSNTLIGDNIFIEKGAKISSSILNSETGPIYIGKNAEIMEGSIIRGPFSLSENSVVKMGAKIYGPTSIGPNCKVGGEINNSVFFGFSSKAHDGFLGNSIIGEWCNLGADSNNSNLKNNYEDVKLWSYEEESFESTKLQFCGLIMGDHSKCGINTMFNTGTVVGVSANIYGGGFPSKFIPSYSWGGSDGFVDYELKRAIELAEVVMKRRGIELSSMDEEILKHVFQSTKAYRN